MSYVRPDRVRETSTTTGTGSITLAGAVTGWRTFTASMSAADTFPYVIEGRDANGAQTSEWETGIGTFTGGALARTTVTGSSNSGNAVSFSSASLVCFVGLNKDGLDDIAEERAAAAVATHVAAGDPHTGYVLESREAVASGVATLDSNIVVPASQAGFPPRRYATAAGRYGIPSRDLVMLIQSGGTLVPTDNRMMVLPFIAHADVTITGASLMPGTPSAAGGLIQVALYAASIDGNDAFVVGALIENFGTLAGDSYGQKTITGLTRAIRRGQAYAICASFSKGCTMYAPRFGVAADQLWAGTNLGNHGSYFYVDAAYPPPASVGAVATEPGGTTQYLASVVTVAWEVT
jgi:hypothetical protein